MVQQGLLLLLLATLAIAVVTDLRARRIPNWLTLPAFAAALLLRGALGGWGGAWGLADGLLGAAIAFVPFLLLALAGGMGMGDVKLVAVVGAGLGAARVLPALACIAIAGGVQGIGALLWSGSAATTLRRALVLAGRALRLTRAPPPPARGATIPYGVAIAIGTGCALLWTA